MSVLRSPQLAGPDHVEVGRFEAALCQSFGVPHAAAVSSGTAALHCILTAMGVGPGDEVIVPALTFIATASAVASCGATPVVVDIEPDSHCVDPAAAAAAVTSRTAAVVAVHLNGHPAPLDRLPRGIPVVSDACQAHGATLYGRSVCALGQAAALSFWQDKLITAAGEGGAVLSNDASLVEKVKLLRSHAQMPIEGTPHSHHVTLGYNYRMTGVQAAVGASQLARLPEILAARRGNAARLTSALRDVPGLLPPKQREGSRHAFWKYVTEVNLEQFTADRDEIVRAIRAEGVPAAPRYPIPLTRQPVLLSLGRLTRCPVAERVANRLITLPLPPAAESHDISDITTAVVKVLSAFHR